MAAFFDSFCLFIFQRIVPPRVCLGDPSPHDLNALILLKTRLRNSLVTWLNISWPLGIVATMPGCDLKFGNDIELSGASFDGAKLTEISAVTGIRFPATSEGLEYLYLGSGIDDALGAKIRIPDEKAAEFLKNALFEEGEETKSSIQIGRGQPWWKPGQLTERMDRSKDLPNNQFLAVTCGREGPHFIGYLSWMTS